MWFFQSSGFGTKDGLMQYVHGTLKRSIIPGPERRVIGESPKVEVRNVLMISPILTQRWSEQIPQPTFKGENPFTPAKWVSLRQHN
jgi:hypothetical protein